MTEEKQQKSVEVEKKKNNIKGNISITNVCSSTHSQVKDYVLHSGIHWYLCQKCAVCINAARTQSEREFDCDSHAAPAADKSITTTMMEILFGFISFFAFSFRFLVLLFLFVFQFSSAVNTHPIGMTVKVHKKNEMNNDGRRRRR